MLFKFLIKTIATAETVKLQHEKDMFCNTLLYAILK